MMEVPIDIENEILSFLDLKCLKKMKKVNKYYKNNLNMKIKLLAISKIKKFFKNIEIPNNIEFYSNEETESKITSKMWSKIFYFYYPKDYLQSELSLLVNKIGIFFGQKRKNDMQKIIDECSFLSTRYKLVNCLKNMTKYEIIAVGW